MPKRASDAQSSEGGISVSNDPMLTAGGVCGDIEEERRSYPPLTEVVSESHGRKWDFNNEGLPPFIGGKQ